MLYEVITCMKEKTIKHLMTLEGDGREVTVEGWIRTKRDSKDVSFLAINDGSCMSSVITSYSIHYTKLYDSRWNSLPGK